MSDIGMPPGFTLFVFSLVAGAFTLLLMLVFLIANAFVQTERPFRQRLPFRFFLGTLLPLALVGLGLLFALVASLDWRMASDDVHELWYLGIFLASLVAGLLLAKKRPRSPGA